RPSGHRVPAYYALIIRSLVTLEGIAINVDPEFKVLSKAYPYISKRLLTDPAPELRASLNDLLFRDGNFRWNRLENLLRNARNSDDYDLNKALNQTLEFLFSERGEFFRDRIADEVVHQLDRLGQDLLHSVNYAIKKNLGIATVPAPAPAPSQSQSFEHITNILGILRDTRGFDASILTSVLPQVLLKPETREMGQRIVGGLAQRAAARLIRGVLLTEPEPVAESNGHRPPQLSLPPAQTER
ncbi:MAG: AarF/ABC1/UbiB kinase family protein, partial [Leptolyngbya sp. SIO4C5]|nr:AarF/ABC1/UbiB kinase family protein [Leptolyngbya sp. SIO4C5]